MAAPSTQIFCSVILFAFCALNLCFAHYTPAVHDGDAHHHCDHGHDHHHSHHHGHHHGEFHSFAERRKLPEELAEEEDLKLLEFGSQHDHDHHHGATELSVIGNPDSLRPK